MKTLITALLSATLAFVVGMRVQMWRDQQTSTRPAAKAPSSVAWSDERTVSLIQKRRARQVKNPRAWTDSYALANTLYVAAMIQPDVSRAEFGARLLESERALQSARSLAHSDYEIRKTSWLETAVSQARESGGAPMSP